MTKKLLCPNCNTELYFNLDDYGRTPWHLHCKNCDINIGSTSQSKAVDLIQTYHKPHTYIEYYDNKIQYIEEINVYTVM